MLTFKISFLWNYETAMDTEIQVVVVNNQPPIRSCRL